MSKFLTFFKLIPRPFLLSILSGILIGTSYIPFSGWFLLICYAPLWIATLEMNQKNASLKKIFFAGWITQFILTLIGFNWIYYVASEFGRLHWSISAGALLLFAALMHIYIPLSLIAAVWMIRRFKITNTLSQLLLMALFLSFAERIWPSIFEWNLAYTLLWIKLPLFQWADAVGFWGLSTLILIGQAFITWALLDWKLRRTRSLVTILSVLFAVSLLSVGGTIKKKLWSKTDQSVQFGVVQGNIGNLDKILAEKAGRFHMHILGIYTGLTSEQLAKHPETEVLLWPETAMPFALDPSFQYQESSRALFAAVKQWNIPLITGAYSIDSIRKDHLGYPLTSNSVFFIGPEQKLLNEAYNKSDLLVFGEYLPLGEQFPFLYKLFPFVGVYKRGDGPAVNEIALKNKNLKLGAQICYESLNPGFSRGLANQGSQILFNVTNDSWFGWWAEPFQHEMMTLARGIEVRRPLVRATNTGISSVILASGEILEQSPLNQTWAHTYSIPYLEKPDLTFYSRFGHFDWIFWILISIAIVYFSSAHNKQKR